MTMTTTKSRGHPMIAPFDDDDDDDEDDRIKPGFHRNPEP